MSQPRDLPILFSGPMVRAILREIEHPGTGKTQTRRVLNPQPDDLVEGQIPRQLRISIGDRLYVREAHYRFGHWEPVEGIRTKTGRQKWQFVEDSADVLFEAPSVFRKGMHHKDPATPAWHVRQGRTMFRHHSCITLIVTDVRVQRLQEISEADAVAEGCFKGKATGRVFENATGMRLGGAEWRNARDWYADLWDSLNAERRHGWGTNPWVAAYTFRPILGNIDQVR